MTPDELQVVGLVVQSASVVVGIGASMVALYIAARNRRASVRQARLMFELDAAVRLAEELIHPGFNDADTPAVLERARSGAQVSALVGALGPRRIPRYWEVKFDSEGELRKLAADPDVEEFWRWAAEAQVAVIDIMRELAAEEARGRKRRGSRRRG